MRRSSLGLMVAGACLAAVVGADLAYGYESSGGLANQRQSLAREVSTYASQGLPETQAAQLRRQLAAIDVAGWWSPTFNFSGQQAALSRVRANASQLWAGVIRTDRARANTAITDYQAYLSSNSAWLSDPVDVTSLREQLASAQTPSALEGLAANLAKRLDTAKAEVQSAEAKAAANVSVAQAPGGLLGQATQLEKIANADNLSALTVPQAAQALRQVLASGQPATAQSAALSDALTQLRAEVGLNNQVTQQTHSLMDLVDQAAAEQTPQSASYLAQYQAADKSLLAARTASQLQAVKTALDGLQAATQNSLNSNQCGHTSIAGKSITISLSLQEMIFYDNGCVANATPVTTGRALLRTPTGTFHIFDKQSPYVFISPWPPGSPFWYPTSPVNWVMEFDQGGYYIHDAPWEPTSVYGPGSQNGVDASHGCVQTPESVMKWAYSWTPMGTPVVITS